MGTTAHVVWHANDKARPVPIDLTIDSVAPTKDADYAPDEDSAAVDESKYADYQVYVVHYTVVPKAAVKEPVDLFAASSLVWSAQDGDVKNIFGAPPDDCGQDQMEKGAKPGKPVRLCGFRFVAPNATVLGATYTDMLDGNLGQGSTVRWQLPAK